MTESSTWLAAGIEAAWRGFPEPLRTHVEVNATIPAVPAHEVAKSAERFPGCRTIKVKVAEPGQTLAAMTSPGSARCGKPARER